MLIERVNMPEGELDLLYDQLRNYRYRRPPPKKKGQKKEGKRPTTPEDASELEYSDADSEDGSPPPKRQKTKAGSSRRRKKDSPDPRPRDEDPGTDEEIRFVQTVRRGTRSRPAPSTQRQQSEEI